MAVDKQVIIASLNLHLLLEQVGQGQVSVEDKANGHGHWNINSESGAIGSETHGEIHRQADGWRSSSLDQGISISNSSSRPHVLVELVHESNAVFLRHKRNGHHFSSSSSNVSSLEYGNLKDQIYSTHDADAQTAAYLSPHCQTHADSGTDNTDDTDDTDTDSDTYAEESETALYEDGQGGELDLPLLQNGGILTHLCLDNLCLQVCMWILGHTEVFRSKCHHSHHAHIAPISLLWDKIVNHRASITWT